MALPPMRRRLTVDIEGLETAFEAEPDMEMRNYLDLRTGEVVLVTEEAQSYADDIEEEGGEDRQAAIEALVGPGWMASMVEDAIRVDEDWEHFEEVPTDEPRAAYRAMEDFIDTVSDPRLAQRLAQAIEGKGAFRRFRDELLSHRTEERRWRIFEREALRDRIVEWLHTLGVEPVFDPVAPPPPPPPLRPGMLEEVRSFVEATAGLPGVARIALIGELPGGEEWPTAAELVVTVTGDTDLSRVATAARRLDGRLQGMRVSGTVFLADLDDRHLGRVCGYKQCGERPPCPARTCGRRRYLFQDSFRLPTAAVSDPPVVVFPEPATRGDVPDDVTEVLLARLLGGR